MSDDSYNQEIVSTNQRGTDNNQAPQEKNTTQVQDLLRRGYNSFKIDDYEKAHQLFEEAIMQDPDSAEAHAWLAAVYGRQIDAAWSLTDKMELFSKLETEVKIALELDSALPLARRMNGSMLLNAPDMLGGDPVKAVTEFRYCIDRGMTDLEIWVSLAKCYLETAELAKAKEALKKALALEPKNEMVLQLLQDTMKEQ
ncbi:tetratricopeptide repeat protein [Gracilibacillus saliphilus]|uniref:tetratricopeptide repeat protein n=1 Tax=Gracilibacillus saliphilus TaxID=543890 RepID=UPI0013D59451|nr:tetratricopeptide repeat protein [Gracilibacillus saliphilus]